MHFYKIWLKYPLQILIGASLFLIAAYFYVSIREDEAWIGEQGYWLFKDGYAHSVLWQGYFNLEERVVFQHYLFTRLTAGLLYVFPWSIYTLRLIPFLSGTVTAFLIYLFVKNVLKWTDKQAFLPPVLFLLFPISSEYLTYYRPEFVVTALGFASFWLLYRFQKKAWALGLSGLITGIAMMVHLNGIIFAFAGGCILLYYLNWKGFFMYVVTTCLGFLPYLIEIATHLDLFLHQLSAGANSGGNNIQLYSFFINLLDEQKRWFRGPYTIFTSALLVVSVWVLLKAGKNTFDRFFWLYTILLVAGMGLFAVSKTSQYSILYYPQFAIIITAAAATFSVNKDKYQVYFRGFYRLNWALFTLVTFGVLIYPFTQKQPDTVKQYAQLSSEIPNGSKTLSSMDFIFNEIADYDIMALAVPYELNNYQLSIAELAAYCREKNADYVILAPLWKKRITSFDQNQETMNHYFETLKTVDEITLYQLRK